MTSHVVLAGLVVALWGAGEAAMARQAVALTPVKDNTLYEDSAGAVSNGAGDHLFAGLTRLGEVRRALVAFDVAGALPAGATVDSVTLTLNLSRTAGAAHPVAVHRVLADWGEGTSDAADNEGRGAAATAGDATWVHAFFDTTAWQTPGGDFVATASADLLVAGAGMYTWGPTEALTADVQAWLDAPESNVGWILLGNEDAELAAKRFDSRDHPDPAVRPVLRVFFSVPTRIEAEAPPGALRLEANYPNPFRHATTITYELERGQAVTLAVYDALGRHVTTLVQAWQQAGRHSVSFNAHDLPGGVYVYHLAADGAQQYGMMTVLR